LKLGEASFKLGDLLCCNELENPIGIETHPDFQQADAIYAVATNLKTR